MRSLLVAGPGLVPSPQEAPGPGCLRLGELGEAGAGDGNEARAVSDLVHIFRHHPSSPSLSSLATRERARASQMDLTRLLAILSNTSARNLKLRRLRPYNDF